MKNIVVSLKILGVFTLLTGMVYPLLVWAVGQTLFNKQANGSLIYEHNKLIGSELIGQPTDTSIYFSPRPSAIGYNPLPSGGSNWGLTNTKLKQAFVQRKQHFAAQNAIDTLHQSVPAEMLFASASGLDPHISPQAALLQVDKVANARHFTTTQRQQLLKAVNENTKGRQLGIFGEPTVNVLLLNLAVDKIK